MRRALLNFPHFFQYFSGLLQNTVYQVELNHVQLNKEFKPYKRFG